MAGLDSSLAVGNGEEESSKMVGFSKASQADVVSVFIRRCDEP
jgi:hypothetical protein